MFNFETKTVVVTGGTSGIGRETALAFLRAGASVIVAGLQTEEDLPCEIRKEVLDIHDAAALESLFADVSEVHVLVNAAGMIRPDDEYELNDLSDVHEVNLTWT